MKFAVLLLLLIMPLSMASAFLVDAHPYNFGVSTNYKAYMGMTLTGNFYQTKTSSELVFWMITKTVYSEYPIRLIFYCKNGTLATQPSNLISNGGGFVDDGYSFCTAIPFVAGQQIIVKGTLVTPSQWLTWDSSPALDFMGDLYVIWVIPQ